MGRERRMARPGLRVGVEDTSVLYRGEKPIVVGFKERHRAKVARRCA